VRPLAARNLHHVRHLLGTNLVDQVNEITRTLNQETETLCNTTLPGDTRRLRGIPAIGHGVQGSVTDQFIPGSDEHLDMLDTLRLRLA
jgi:hypothetical protein